VEAAGRGVRFQMVINQHSAAAEEFRALFDPIEAAGMIEAPNNAISMPRLSGREVVIAFPGVESYTVALVSEKYLAGIVKAWFDRHAHKHGQPAN
jgi:hypothetical protein